MEDRFGDGRRWRDVYAEADLSLGEMVGVNVGRFSILLIRTPDGISGAAERLPP
jgi:hypothetical protein